MNYRVLVTGSRGWTDRDRLDDALDALLAVHNPVTIVHGAARSGVDAMAQSWALDRWHETSYGAAVPEPHPADWDTHGRAAGYRRNEAMVALGADVCLAFVVPCAKRNCRISGPHDSHGTAHCAELAEKAGIPVTRFRDELPAGRKGMTS